MKKMRILITGGAGFIGSNLTARMMERGHKVRVLDNLSRKGADANLEWLRTLAGHQNLEVRKGDITDESTAHAAMADIEVVYHLAGQVAVTSSVENPRRDFNENALGTLNLLEAARLCKAPPIFVFSSTNKVYGGLDQLSLAEQATRYAIPELPHGIPEEFPLDFHSPYGCSKGAADQYVRDYARIYGLRTVVFRQSCIYGYRQFGVEDQGWVAWFIIACLTGQRLRVYGNGKQTRDVLFIDDLLDAYEAALDRINTAAGQVYNIGGGPNNAMSVWKEFGEILNRLTGNSMKPEYADWRPGDQRIFIADIRRAQKDLGWSPKVAPADGIHQLYRWTEANLELFRPPQIKPHRDLAAAPETEVPRGELL
jgi:CDP-paratose 2-epimerase